MKKKLVFFSSYFYCVTHHATHSGALSDSLTGDSHTHQSYDESLPKLPVHCTSATSGEFIYAFAHLNNRWSAGARLSPNDTAWGACDVQVAWPAIFTSQPRILPSPDIMTAFWFFPLPGSNPRVPNLRAHAALPERRTLSGVWTAIFFSRLQRNVAAILH